MAPISVIYRRCSNGTGCSLARCFSTADQAVQAAGPWLVALDQTPDAIDTVLALVDDKPAAVAWHCHIGESVLYRHLRTLNMANIPNWAADGGTEQPDDPAQPEIYKTVMFRHWDPRVLGALMPCLDAAQFNRVLGPAEEIAFWTADFRGLRRVVREINWPAAASGLLSIRSEQMLNLGIRQNSASLDRMASYLRQTASAETASLDRLQLLACVSECESIARRMGVQSERAMGALSFIVAKNNWRAPACVQKDLNNASNKDQMMMYILSAYENGTYHVR